jgi:RNA polymerase sigma factor (sigma-70 family)
MKFEKLVTDIELVRRARSGERPAFALLMARYRPAALRLAFFLTRSEEAAREAVQEASLRAYLSLDRLREPERFGEWLRGIVRNICRERVPMAVAWDAPECEPLLPMLPDTARLASGRADDRAVREAVALLSPALRGAVQRFYFEGWSVEETAAQLSISVGAVKVRLHDARRRLKPLLENQFPEFTSLASPIPPRRKIMSVSVHMVEMPTLTPALKHEPVTSPETARLFLMKMTVHFPRRLLLADTSGDRFLPLLIESVDFGMALATKHFEKFGLLDLTLRLLEATGSTIQSVELQMLEKEVPVAVLTMDTAGKTITVEARPTDAMALALKQELPLTISTPLMERDGWHIPDPETIVRHIQDGDITNPFLIRVAQMLLQEVAKWRESGGELTFEQRDNLVWNGLGFFDKEGNRLPNMMGRSFPSYMPPDAFPAILTRMKHLAGLDINISEREQSGDVTLDSDGIPVRITVQITPGEQGETLTLRCHPTPRRDRL